MPDFPAMRASVNDNVVTGTTMQLLNEALLKLQTPPRIARLPISETGYYVPWFVAWLDQRGQPCLRGHGIPDFRVIFPGAISEAVSRRRCWICGDVLGQHLAFCLGPMCAINRVIAEPPSHRECAEFSARACPFLSRPRMRRNEKDLPEHRVEAAGFALKRNPGAVAVWITRDYRPFRPHAGNRGVLFAVGDPLEVLWFAHGRPATRGEVEASIASGYPSLLALAQAEGPEAIAALERARRAMLPLLPAEELAHA